ncbi:alpha/beta hydrolase [Pseudonocardia zijingensis]|jgi:pimeloyl-ACP methyl ester carboxylesterase|uniref:Alpha/beta hydrolase n=1 Tax=Pseudonocardia zijingensis TaxID=153376 RepID=A0ABP3YSM1_9PSEU
MHERTTAQTREVRRCDHTTIRYSASGPLDGPAVVFIHGWGCNRTDFDAVTAFLPDHCRVLAVDLAEHGGSRSTRDDWTMAEFARDAAAVLAAEGVTSCTVVGHSLGAAVAVELGRQLPDVVTHVVALDGLHYLALFPPQTEEHVEAVLRPFREDFTAAMRGMVASGSPPGTDPALNDTYVAKMAAVRQPAGLRSLEGLVRWHMDDALAELTQPVTVFGVRALVSPEAVARYGDRIRFELVDLGTHHFPVESPERTAALVAGVVGA